MKIGIFDSGLGGLIIAKSIIEKMPKYDYIYLGDTKNLPYGEKTPGQIYNFTKAAVDFLFKQDCAVVIVACNTSSAWALRKIQQKYLPAHYPERRVLGVVIPTLESVVTSPSFLKRGLGGVRKIGVVATSATVKSHIYKKELLKINPKAEIYELATPDLTPLIEKDSLQKAEKSLELYLKTLQQKGIDALILGCTHYLILKSAARKVLGNKVKIVSQDEIIPLKLFSYFKKHAELNKLLSKNKTQDFRVTQVDKNFQTVADKMFGKKIKLTPVSL